MFAGVVPLFSAKAQLLLDTGFVLFGSASSSDIISLKASNGTRPSTSLSSSREPDRVFAIIRSKTPSYLNPQKSKGFFHLPFFFTQKDFSLESFIP